MSGPAWTPWEAVSPDDPRGQPSAVYRGLVCYVSTDPCLAVVTADGSSVPPDQWPQVARLIAAAPDLFEAASYADRFLDRLLIQLDGHPDDKGCLREIRDQLRAALSKALGTGGA